MDGGAWQAAVHGVAKSQTRLSDFTFTFTFHFHALEKEMATHSNVLAWRIPGMAGPLWAAVYGVAQSRTRLERLSSSSSSQYITVMHNKSVYYRLKQIIFSLFVLMGYKQMLDIFKWQITIKLLVFDSILDFIITQDINGVNYCYNIPQTGQ